MVLTCGSVSSNCVEQVKGVTYSLDRFLGPDDWPRMEQVRGILYSLCRFLGLVGSTPADVKSQTDADTDYIEIIKCHKKDTELYQAVIYLAPGDYHRFHSPTEWTVSFRRYFPGLIVCRISGILYYYVTTAAAAATFSFCLISLMLQNVFILSLVPKTGAL